VSDDGDLVLAQPPAARRKSSQAPPPEAAVTAAPLVGGLWVWERDTHASSRAESRAGSDGIPVAPGTWTQLNPLAEAAASGEPTLAVQFRGEAGIGRGCVVAHGVGSLAADGSGAWVRVASLQQPLRAAEPTPGAAAPRAVWTSRVFALAPGGDELDAAHEAEEEGMPLDVRLQWDATGETLAVTVSATDPSAELSVLRPAAAQVARQASAAFVPWTLLLAADLRPIALHQWPHTDGAGMRLRESAWLADGFLLATLTAAGSVHLMDKQGQSRALSVRHPLHAPTSGAPAMAYHQWACDALDQQAAGGAKTFSLCAVNSRHLALCDGSQVAVWAVQLPGGWHGAHGPNAPLPELHLTQQRRQQRAPADAGDNDEAAACEELSPPPPVALEVATRLARLVAEASGATAHDAARLRLRLRVAVRAVRQAALASGELHAALHITHAAAAAAGDAAAAATAWRVLAAEALRDGDGEADAADAYRVARVSLQQAAREKQAAPTLAHLAPVAGYWANTDANFIKAHLHSGDLMFLRGKVAEAGVCYLRAGVAGLPSLLALALLAGDAGGAMAVVGAAWQLTCPARVVVVVAAGAEAHSSAVAVAELMRWERVAGGEAGRGSAVGDADADVARVVVPVAVARRRAASSDDERRAPRRATTPRAAASSDDGDLEESRGEERVQVPVAVARRLSRLLAAAVLRALGDDDVDLDESHGEGRVGVVSAGVLSPLQLEPAVSVDGALVGPRVSIFEDPFETPVEL
jgi:hypothetical protein